MTALLLALVQPCALALALVQAEHAADMPGRAAVCAEVTVSALVHGVDPWLAVSVAFHESRLSAEARSAVAVGPMQVVPRWWCPGRREQGCDVVDAGMLALVTYTSRYGLSEGLARYNAGNNPGPRARAYARRVLSWL